jgi:hypothetical protein
MHAEHWTTEDCELEGYAVRVSSYQLGIAYLTEIESIDSGTLVGRGVAGSFQESRQKALAIASQRLLRASYFNLTVGG